MKDSWWKASLGALVVLTLGCGRTVAGGDAIEGTGAGDPAVGAGDPPPGLGQTGAARCGALGLEADAPLLVTGFESDLWLVRANGELTALDHGFGTEIAPDGPIFIESVTIEGDYALVEARVGNFDSYLPPSELALFARDGRRLWRYTPRSPGSGVISDAMLDERGFVSFYEYSLDLGQTTVVMTPAGERFVDSGSTPLSRLDAQGWMAVGRSDLSVPSGQLYGYGLLHPSDGAYVGVRFVPLTAVSWRPIKAAQNTLSSLVYLTLETWNLSAVLENANEAHLFELPQLAAGEYSDMPFNLQLGENWAIIMHDGLPVLRIDLDAKQAFPVDSSSLVASEPHPYVAIGGDRFLAQAAGQILWRLDAATGSFLPIDLGGTLRIMDRSSYCTPNIALTEDGRLVLPLTDEVSGGMYLERPGGSWVRLGMPFMGVTFANATRHGEGWLVRTDDGNNTYCGHAVSGPPNGQAPAGTLVGDSLQILLPERGIARALSIDSESIAAVHTSGLCVALYDGSDLSLYDPVSDTSEVVVSTSSERRISSTRTAFF